MCPRSKWRAGSDVVQSSVSAPAPGDMYHMEFALLLPVMLLFVAGTVDISEGLTVHRKIRQISSIVVDLVAQSSKISQSEVNTILAGAAKILDPYPNAKLTIVVSVLDVKNKKKQKVAWSSGPRRPHRASRLSTP